MQPFIDSSPVAAAGCPVIVGAWAGGTYTSTSTTGYVAAYGPTTSTRAWRYPESDSEFIGAVASTPAVFTWDGNKRVVFGSMDGKVYCLRVFAEYPYDAGSLVWSYGTTSTVESPKILASPVVYDGRVYIGNESATVYCLNAGASSTAGECIWSQTFTRDSTWPDRTGVSSVAIGQTSTGETRAYVGCDNGHVYCLSLTDGNVLWDYAGEDGQGLGCVESSPTVYAGNVYVGTSWFEGRDVVALSADSGALVWYGELSEEARATCAIADAAVFVGVDTGTQFYRLSSATGDQVPLPPSTNPFDAEDDPPDPPAGSNNYFVGSAALDPGGDPEEDPRGFCLVGNDNYALYTLSSADLTLLTTRGLGGIVCSSPAISYAAESGYRWVYVLARPGTLRAFRQGL